MTSLRRHLHQARAPRVGAVLRHEVDDPVCDRDEAVVVGRHDDRTTVGPQAAKERDDALGLDVVQVGRGFVGEQDGGVGRQASSDGHPLLLASRKPVGAMPSAVGQVDPGEELVGSAHRPAATDSGEEQRDRHVLAGGQRRDQVERLEHESDGVLPVGRELARAQRLDLDPGDADGARRRAEDPAERRQQRRLPAPRGPEQDHQPPADADRSKWSMGRTT